MNVSKWQYFNLWVNYHFKGIQIKNKKIKLVNKPSKASVLSLKLCFGSVLAVDAELSASVAVSEGPVDPVVGMDFAIARKSCTSL